MNSCVMIYTEYKNESLKSCGTIIRRKEYYEYRFQFMDTNINKS